MFESLIRSFKFHPVLSGDHGIAYNYIAQQPSEACETKFARSVLGLPISDALCNVALDFNTSFKLLSEDSTIAEASKKYK